MIEVYPFDPNPKIPFWRRALYRIKKVPELFVELKCHRCGKKKLLPVIFEEHCASCRKKIDYELRRLRENPKWNPIFEFRSAEDWLTVAGLNRITNVRSPGILNLYLRWIHEYEKVLFQKHVKTLSPKEQQQIESGEHPSQLPYDKKDEAEPIRQALFEKISHLPYVKNVSFGCGQLNTLRIAVEIDGPRDLNELRSEIPMLFHGFIISVTYEVSGSDWAPVIRLFPN